MCDCASAKLLSSEIALEYAARAESHSVRRRYCSPVRKARIAGSEVEPIDARRTAPTGWTSPMSRSSASVSESAIRSIRSVASRSSIGSARRRVTTSTSHAVTRAESRPAASTRPSTTKRAPVRFPKATADSTSAWPSQLRITTDGGTVRNGPAPSRFDDRRSTNPSRQSVFSPCMTSNGAMATRSSSTAGLEPPRQKSTAEAIAAASSARTPSGRR